jgi:hypothetical protein
MLLVFAICVLIAAGLALPHLPFGRYLQMFGINLFIEGLILLIFGGAIGAGGWYKVYNIAWLRSQKRAMKPEMETYHKDRHEYTIYGYYLAAVGVLLIFIGLIFTIL